MLSFAPNTRLSLVVTLVVGMTWGVLALPALAGSYLDSAHGNAVNGVNASVIDAILGEYATGNCGHCHQMHASLEGAEPAPVGGPAPHALFWNNFNLARTESPYLETDNFCFSCHSDFGQQVVNQDYSAVFGGASSGSGPQSILTAFNQASYHNLFDIATLVGANPAFDWFGTAGNPCSACHNSHLAKSNGDSSLPGFPLLSAISRPGSRSSLWGETELMQSYSAYEAPFALGLGREPAGIGDSDGGNTPDYVMFCSSCHNPDTSIWSTSLNRELKKLNWESVGLQQDKHGPLVRDDISQLREPYASAAATKSNFVLSCLDCHEAHGSENSMLLRRRINGENLEGTITTTAAMSFACRRCHADDLISAAGTNEANSWQYVHHQVQGAPYVETSCTSCHVMTGGVKQPIACGNCHGHGMDDSWAGARMTGRRTF